MANLAVCPLDEPLHVRRIGVASIVLPPRQLTAE
jgi:hypothetical protein